MSSNNNKVRMKQTKSLALNVKALSVVSLADVERARLFFAEKVKGKYAKIIEAPLKETK